MILRHPSFYIGASVVLASFSLLDIAHRRYPSLIVDGSLIIIVLVLFLVCEIRIKDQIYPHFHRHNNTRLLSCKRYYCPGCRALLNMDTKRVMDKNIGARR